MTPKAIQSLARGAVLLVSSGLLAGAVHAQQVFRIVGLDGKVTFSDQPPPVNSAAKVTAGTGPSISGSVPSPLPFELKQVVAKYPVSLYTGANCAPCMSARAMLTSRGIPFTEKTITTVDDSQALQRISGSNNLPFATIGGQQLNGFSDSEWNQFLNAAGYPTVSALPAGYRFLAPTPLVVVVTTPATSASASNPSSVRAAESGARPMAPPAQTGDNPAGIKF